MNPTAPFAYIFSNANFFAENISKQLTEKGCGVKKITSEKFPSEFSSLPSYIFIIQIGNEFTINQLNKILEFSKANKIKTQIILDYEIDVATRDLLDSIKATNLEIVYLQESENGVSENEIVKKIIRAMFSYGFGERETVLNVKESKEERVVSIEMPVIRPIKVLNKKKERDHNDLLRVTSLRRGFGRQAQKFVVLILIVICILSLPFLALWTSRITLAKGFDNLKQNDFKSADFYFKISKNLSDFSQKTLMVTSQRKLAEMIGNYDRVGVKMEQTLKEGELLTKNIFGNEDFDITTSSNNLFLDLDNLYNEVNFLRADRVSENYLDLDYLIKYIDNGRKIIRQLPNLLGENKLTNYLVVLQDKNELRATGGKITQLGIYTFNHGRLTNKNMFDVSAADSQLRGEILPPVALQKYLGITSWHMKDANWDPDFLQSASKMEWFLQKEMNQSVDGVIVMNDKTVNFQALNNKDIQVFSNNEKVEDALTNLSWDGGFSMPTCDTQNCEAEMLGLIEDNLGGNQINQNIKRSVNFFIDKTQNESNYNLAISYENTSETQNYRTYVRVNTNLNTNFKNVVENINKLDETIVPDINQINGRNEVGVMITVPHGKSATLTYTWSRPKSLDFTKSGKILFYLRKQSGIASIKTDIRFVLPSSLTTSAPTSYNTSLEHDENYTLSW